MATTAELLAPSLYAYGALAEDAAGTLTASSIAAPTGSASGGVVALNGSATRPFAIPLGAVVEILVNNTDGGEHPFHLHGHTSWVVATSAAPDAGALYAPHYARRDVVSVPASGWARIRFVADNPGIWLFHCHLGACVRACVMIGAGWFPSDVALC
jgi:FtsP/CotA-like multicopper oxidase with cupredoxin domain